MDNWGYFALVMLILAPFVVMRALIAWHEDKWANQRREEDEARHQELLQAFRGLRRQ